ncbi:MAG: hypothetical protein WC661_21720 [Opitutaceae bacterium]|jgi:hypothetical protein
MNDHDPLSRVLNSWKHNPSHTPDFAKTVWARIDAPEEAPAPSFFAQFLHFPSHLPIAASFAVILAVLAGTGAGLALNHGQSTDRMAAAYVRSIDPLQMTADATASHSHS